MKPKHTAVIIRRDLPGFSLAPHDEKLGIKAAHSCSIFFENVHVPKEYILGEEGQGFKVAMVTLDGGRIGIAAQALGIAQAAYERAVTYAKERKAFGGTIAKLQADPVHARRHGRGARRRAPAHAARRRDEGQGREAHSAESAMAKLFASEMATRVTHKAIQVHGGYGYTTEYGVERHYRDARITELYEGTSEIQRIVIAANCLR
jgi:butyryl-CoA dehydrogenase